MRGNQHHQAMNIRADSSNAPHASAHPTLATALATVLIIAALLAAAGSFRGEDIAGLPLFASAVSLTFGIQWLAYIPAYLKQTEKFYDLLGGTGFIVGTLFIFFATEHKDARTWVLASLIILWALRLAGFLFWRVHRFGGDDRFDHIKPNKLRFLLTWTLQALWIAATSSAAWIAMASIHRQEFGVISWVGLALWVLGMMCEVTADIQKTIFKANPANQGKFISTGLWAHSRHPNYFGEITLWLGVFLISAPTLTGWQWAGVISPIMVVLLLTRVSGIPLLEKKADKKWGDNPDYRTYKTNTPVLIPQLRAR